MKHLLAALLVFACLVSPALPAGALELRHGLELQGGMGHWGAPAEDMPWTIEYLWAFEGGLGLFSELELREGLRVGSGISLRRVGDELEWSGDYGGSTWTSSSRMRVDQLVLPVRAELALPLPAAIGVELGAQAEYVLKAEERIEPAAIPVAAMRATVPYAQIFEDLSDYHEVTDATNRLGAAATAGLTWRTSVFGHPLAVGARYERGLTGLWKDGLDRFANRVHGSLRWAF